MRKVKFIHYVNGQWIEGEGVFHQWGQTFTKYESGPGNCTIAIVEDSDGNVHEIVPHHLQFKPEER